MPTLKLAVKDLALPILKRGSIRRSGLFNEPDIGAALHTVIQNSYKDDESYQREVHLTGEFQAGDYNFKISGRADGLFATETPLIEEIKTTFSSHALMKLLEDDAEHPYRLQTQVYGHLYYLKTGLIPQCRILVYSLVDQAQTFFEVAYDPADFQGWLRQKLQQLVEEEHRREKRRVRRIKLAENLAFPFAQSRPHQDALLAAVRDACVGGTSLMVQAPTGIGKTMGTLLPALKEATSRGSQLIYLAPKNAQFEVAVDAVKTLQEAGYPIKLLVLTAQSKMCLHDQTECQPEGCPYGQGYYDRLNEIKILDKARKQGLLDKSRLLQMGRRHQVCAYELSMEMIENADIIVGDYNYVFGHQAGLSRIFMDRPKGEAPNLVIDEAHNLYQRGMDYYSPSFEIRDIEAACATEVPKDLEKKWKNLTQRILKLLDSQRPATKRSQVVALDVKKFEDIQSRLLGFFLDYLASVKELARHDRILQLYRSWNEFSIMLSLAEDESPVSWVFDQGGERLTITCCNASRHLKNRMAHFNSVVAFSATLKPANFYRQLSGFSEDTPFMEFPTAFPPENRKLLIIPQVSTAYRDRERNYSKIAEAISRLMAQEPGHYLAFFPSFQFIAALRPHLQLPDYRILCQESSMSADQAQNFILHLDQDEEPILILAVQGGMLAEGIDYDSPTLKGVFVVGPGIPSISYERDILRDYYERTFGHGFAYAYIYPGMAKSIQAAGRVIRSETKRGLVVLMDHRFVQPEYSTAMPSYWFHESPQELVQAGLLGIVKSFWKTPQPAFSQHPASDLAGEAVP